MPVRKPKPPPEPEKINPYGWPLVQGRSQLAYDRAAFARRKDVTFGCPTRPRLFKKIADSLLPGHFEWHEWTDDVVRTMSEHNMVAYPGAAGCVHPDTRILNPITGEQPTIKELTDKGIAPIVMTLNGPEQACVPYVKGTAELFEIALSDGSRFWATAEHRVLVSNANASHHLFCRVSDLRVSQSLPAYAPFRHPSILDNGPLIHGQDALDSQRTVADCQEHYSLCSHPYDAQPPWETGIDQSSFPSQADAHTRSQHGFCEDGLKSESCGILSPYGYHLSTPDCGHRGISLDNHEQLRSHPEIHEREFQLFRQPFQSEQETPSLLPFLEPTRNSSDTEFYGDVSRLSDMVSSYGYTVSQVHVVSIRKTGEGIYYDIEVPKSHHYFAEGAIHHNSCKTFNIVSFAVVWWLCDPDQSSVTLVSTSKDSLKKRGWAEVLRCYSEIPGKRFGNMVNSQLRWECKKGDSKHAIVCKAVEEGPLHKVADDIKGIHTRRQMILIDEATAVPEAIWEASCNLYSYPEEFIIACMGNPLNRLDQFGRFCEPEGGWTSVSVDSKEWKGKPQEKYGGLIPNIVRFDAEKSPNIVEGRIVSRHLPTQEKVDVARKFSGGQTPAYWQNFRGFWPPEGLSKTIFSESALIKNDGFGKHLFTGRRFMIIGAFDPARNGGDRAALRFAKLGEIEGGKWGIEVFPPKTIPVMANSTNPIDYQLTEQVRRECESFESNGTKYSCPPENLIIDDTGDGGLGDIMHRTWSSLIFRVKFSWSASDEPVSLEDIRLCSEVYQNKRVEMHFRARDTLNHGQLKGIDRETAIELCNVEFDDMGKKIKLMLKQDYKAKFGKSPDYGDTVCMLVEMARIRGFRLAAIGETAKRVERWDDGVKAASAVYENASYESEEMDMSEAMI